MLIRAALPEDASSIAAVHVASWRTTYRGLMPDVVLDALSVQQRQQQWQQIALSAQKPDSGSFLLVAEAPSEGIVGFASSGPEREDGTGFDAELYAIYLLENYQGRGIGRKLIDRSVDLLRKAGCDSLRVWVLAGNPAEQFYSRLGGKRSGEKPLLMAGRQLSEVSYAWHDLTTFR